jgi:tetratricopeptide (TPR) repeat protein
MIQYRYLCEFGRFNVALSIVKEACDVLEQAVETNDHPGYFPQYMRRLIADLYSTIGSIEYELNLPNHGRPWFEKADEQRRKLIEDDTAQSYDIEVMANGDGNIALSCLADNGTPETCISVFNGLIDNFNNNKNNRSIWAANLSIAYRFQGNLEESLKWCNVASQWTSEVYGNDSLSMAM